MAEIMVLDSKTIDQIAAGEVVERPSSVVKELVENACDAGATAVTVEIKDGGTSFIRVTDNGSGIEKAQIRKAFLRHATSKIRGVEDLSRIHSLGFRGEALSSICAVSMVELITRTKNSLVGVRYCIEGEREADFSEIGAPEGTTILVRDLFYNTPARKKFLKTPATEGGYIADLMEHMALSRPDISFTFQINRQTRFSTSGSGDLKEVIYRIYGREIAKEIFPFEAFGNGFSVKGFLGSPQLVRPNRNFEFFFVNNRYIKSQVLSKGLESGYQAYLMQHKFPMAYLHLQIDTEQVDVNVHPSKMEVRFSDNRRVFDFLEEQVQKALHDREMIPQVVLDDDKRTEKSGAQASKQTAVSLTQKLLSSGIPTGHRQQERKDVQAAAPMPDSAKQRSTDMVNLYKSRPARSTAISNQSTENSINKPTVRALTNKVNMLDTAVDGLSTQKTEEESAAGDSLSKATADPVSSTGAGIGTSENVGVSSQRPQHHSAILPPQPFEKKRFEQAVRENRIAYETQAPDIAKSEQLNLFDEKILSRKAVDEYQLIGQIFDTYWIAVYHDKMILIDQHAAHEKVKYEMLMKRFYDKQPVSQNLMPPLIVTLTGAEAALLEQYQEYFEQLGFEIDSFGGSSYAMRAVPCDLYGHCEAEFLQDILDELGTGQTPNAPTAIAERIATMACKSAVKGNNRLSLAEMQELLEQLLTLDNPYHCPHGRPTMIVMTKQELERKFKRIV